MNAKATMNTMGYLTFDLSCGPERDTERVILMELT